MARTTRRFGPVLKDAWRLARPYFRSEEKWSAWVLLISTIVLSLSLVGMSVVLNFWNGAFYNALQHKDAAAFFRLLVLYQRTPNGILPGFCEIAAVYIVVAVASTYLTQWLQIRWRRWLTGRFLDEWLADRAYYRISLTADPAGTGTDNPDQRIADDLRSYVNSTLSLGLDLLSNIVNLISFASILWVLSGSIRLLGLVVPGYMLWVAVIYAIVGTWLTHLVGKPLAALSFQQQQVEADFRFALVRLRENTEGVALYGGEAEERAGLADRFRAVVANWWAIMQRTKWLNTLVSGYAQVAVIFPIIVAAPRFFAGVIQLGGLTRIAGAFGNVQNSLSWFVNSYALLANWAAVVERLGSFHRAIEAARAGERISERSVLAPDAGGADLSLSGLTLSLPDGRVLLSDASLTFRAGESVVVTGRSGSGKSTLFRAIAGIWPFAKGRIALPAGRTFFLPQRPYIPLGTLRRAITYPDAPETASDAACVEVLAACGLAHLLPALDQVDNWSQRLSGGEQQRLAVARAVLAKPDWLFLDEATASLDPEAEAELYGLLHARLPGCTIVSIAHRESVAALHERKLVLRRDDAGGHLVPAPVAAPAGE
ncbi:MAG TPA: ABC transporter ATP-binding protein/permease [Acetobacteraceae bacterium]|nr:ABC transporter ATP-binding protein/permease [Acetobacteraceae bacterium]